MLDDGIKRSQENGSRMVTENDNLIALYTVAISYSFQFIRVLEAPIGMRLLCSKN